MLHTDYITIHMNSLHIIPFVSCTDQTFFLFKNGSGQFHKGLNLKKKGGGGKSLLKNAAVQMKLKAPALAHGHSS